jgi:hypothetical protein
MPVPGNFGVLIEEDGTDVVGVGVWDAVDSTGGVVFGGALKMQVEFRRQGQSAWRKAELAAASGGSVQTAPLAAGQDYEFRARSVGITRVSDYTPTITREATADAVAPSAPTDRSTVEDDGEVTIQWTQPASANAYGCRVYRNTVAGSAGATLMTTRWGGPSVVLEATDDPPAGTYWYYVAAINGSGVESAKVFAGAEVI